jgi:hypothetical protein
MNQTLERAHDDRNNARSKGLLPARGPDENLAVADGTRIHCTALRVDHHKLFVGAFGPEQTRIIYTFAGILAEYKGVNIRSVCTSRTEGEAGSYILLGDISGNAEALMDLGRNIQIKPWLEPAGKKVVPDAVIDLKIIAPARRTLLLDALSIISEDYGINIESMVHRTFHNLFDHGFDLLRQITRGGLGGVPPKARRRTGNTGTGGPATGGPGTGGLGMGGPRTHGAGAGGLGTGGLGTGGPGTDGPGTDGPGTDGPGTDGPGTGGPGTGGPGTGGRGLGGRDTERGAPEGDGGGFITVTHMRLELPNRRKVEDLMRDLNLIGTDWELRWEQRAGQGKYDLKKLFGELN